MSGIIWVVDSVLGKDCRISFDPKAFVDRRVKRWYPIYLEVELLRNTHIDSLTDSVETVKRVEIDAFGEV